MEKGSFTMQTLSIPICQDLLGFGHFGLRASEAEFHFSSPATDDHFDSSQAVALHAQVKLFVGFVVSVVLEAIHDGSLVTSNACARSNLRFLFLSRQLSSSAADDGGSCPRRGQG